MRPAGFATPGNAGVSSTRNRTTMPITTSTRLSRNPIRQPYDRNCAGPNTTCSSAKMPVPRARPKAKPICGIAPIAAAPVLGAVFDGQQHRAAPLAAERKALQHPQQQQQHRCPRPDLRGGRQYPDQCRRDAHDEHGQRQAALTADPVADVTEHQTADGPHDKPDGERRERQQRADQGTGVGKEHLVEHQPGRGGVEEEVVPLDCGAQQACRDDDAQPPATLGVGFVLTSRRRDGGIGQRRRHD